MQISRPTRVLLGGVIIALLIYGAGQMMARNVESAPDAFHTDPRLRALAGECQKTGDIYDAMAKHYGGTSYDQDGTLRPIELKGACDKLWRLWDEIEPYPPKDVTAESHRRVALSQYAEVWATPVAAGVLALCGLPWLWYFILRRIGELRNAIIGK